MLEDLPRTIECFDIFPHPGRGNRRLHGGLGRRRDEEERLPQIQNQNRRSVDDFASMREVITAATASRPATLTPTHRILRIRARLHISRKYQIRLARVSILRPGIRAKRATFPNQSRTGSRHAFIGSRRERALYQGTTSVVPKRPNKHGALALRLLSRESASEEAV